MSTAVFILTVIAAFSDNTNDGAIVISCRLCRIRKIIMGKQKDRLISPSNCPSPFTYESAEKLSLGSAIFF